MRAPEALEGQGDRMFPEIGDATVASLWELVSRHWICTKQPSPLIAQQSIAHGFYSIL